MDLGWRLVSELMPEIICLSVDAVICGILYKVYIDTTKAIVAVQRAPSIDLDLLKDIDKYIKHNGICKEDNKEVSIPYIIIRGTIHPLKSSLESHYQKDVKGVIRSFSITEFKKHFSRMGFWVDAKRDIQNYTNVVPFTLGCSSNKNSVQVMDYSKATQLDLDTTFDKFDLANNDLSSLLGGWLVGDRQAGVQSVEKMLVNGTEMTAIGELVLDQSTGKVSIQAPTNGEDYHLIKETAKDLVENYQNGAKVVRTCFVIFATVGVCIAAYGAWKAYQSWQQHQEANAVRNTLRDIIQERTNAEENEENSPGEGVERELPENLSCVVCLGQQREVILMNCGHVAVCADCATEIMQGNAQCPVCRAPIARVAAAYIA